MQKEKIYIAVQCRSFKSKRNGKRMNELAEQGWTVLAQPPNMAMGYGVVVIFVKEK